MSVSEATRGSLWCEAVDIECKRTGRLFHSATARSANGEEIKAGSLVKVESIAGDSVMVSAETGSAIYDT